MVLQNIMPICHMKLGILTVIIFIALSSDKFALATSDKYVVTKQRALQGWIKKWNNINRLQCLVACSRMAYCRSVNYDPQNLVCQLSKKRKSEISSESFQSNDSFDYMEKIQCDDCKSDGCCSIYHIKEYQTYDQAKKLCKGNLGSLASYEQLYQAFQPHMVNCTEGWLISGEIAFTEIDGDKCTMKPPNNRSNVFPYKTSLSGMYCYIDINPDPDVHDYTPSHQRIIRIRRDLEYKLNASDSKDACDSIFSGRLSTPEEVFNATKYAGVNLCERGWFSMEINGNVCDNGHGDPLDIWDYPLGNRIIIRDPSDELTAFCYIPLPGENLTYPDPFPPHRVVNVQGVQLNSLNFYDAKNRCHDLGGELATFDQVSFAQQSGYHCCKKGWVLSGEVISPSALITARCPVVGIINKGYKNKTTDTFDGFCFFPSQP